MEIDKRERCRDANLIAALKGVTFNHKMGRGSAQGLKPNQCSYCRGFRYWNVPRGRGGNRATFTSGMKGTGGRNPS